MSPYPTAQMHAAQKRGMYPMGHHMQPAQNIPMGPMYPNSQQNFVPVQQQMHQGYNRPGGVQMNAYGRVPGMMPQQRQMAPQYNMPQVANQSQYYGSGQNPNLNTPAYQNVQG